MNLVRHVRYLDLQRRIRRNQRRAAVMATARKLLAALSRKARRALKRKGALA